MDYFKNITHPYRYLINNNFSVFFELKSDYPVTSQDWLFRIYPEKYKKYRRFLVHSEPYTKHYMFDILCKKIDTSNLFDTTFIEKLNLANDEINIKNTNNIDLIDINNGVEGDHKFCDYVSKYKTYTNDSYKNIKFIFDRFHENYKYFYLITKDYSNGYECVTFDTTQINNNNNDENENNYLNNFITENERITSVDYELIKKFISDKIPIYQYMLPENIDDLKAVYVEFESYDMLQMYAMSDDYLYMIYSQR